MNRRLDAPEVRENYATTAALETRSAVWGPTEDGRSAMEVVAQQIVAAHPVRYLDIGTGMGALPALIAREVPRCEVTAVDASAAMVQAASGQGVRALQADIAELPFEDASFDVASANWMLYHVADLGGALREVARVLTDDATFVAATNGRQHLAELFDLADLVAPEPGFSRENGEDILRRHFDSVMRIDLATHATFADSAAAERYLRTIYPEATLPHRDAELRFAGAPTVFVARGPLR